MERRSLTGNAEISATASVEVVPAGAVKKIGSNADAMASFS